jgi:hypothetical protein
MVLFPTISSEAGNSALQHLVAGDRPTATVCGRTEGEVNRKVLLDKPQLELRGCPPSTKIIGFTMSLVRKNKAGDEVFIELSTEGAALSGKMKEQIKELPKGSKVYFENISIVDAEGRSYRLATIVVSIS